MSTAKWTADRRVSSHPVRPKDICRAPAGALQISQGIIAPGATKSVVLPITQQAGTSWYHPHLKGTAAAHVHAGLAGLYLIEDENSQTLALPKHYGVDDIPLIIQDRTFANGKMKPYSVNNEQIMDGLREPTLIANGTINPHHNVPAGWVRCVC